MSTLAELNKRLIAPPDADISARTIKIIADYAAAGASAEELISKIDSPNFEKILDSFYTQDTAMKRLKDKVRLIRQHDEMAPVLITGPTGTGKEILAHAFEIKDEPFIAVNCGGLAENLVPSTFFGHVKGSFTGAAADHKGLLVSARNGVVFLDEIAELPKHLQAMLLRAIDQNEVFPVGSTQPVEISCRFIGATKHNLEDMVEKKEFREDLFSRLRVFELKVSGLKERPDDIDYIASKALNWHEPITNPDALKDIHNYNVRGVKAYVSRMRVFKSY